MNVSLPPEMEQLVHERVHSGLYGSASEVVREALRALFAQERSREALLDALRADIAVGLSDLEQGRTAVLDEQARDAVKARMRRRLAEGE